MSKLDKRLLREADIIQATLTLLEQKGFLDLKMSEVARQAEYSMGTLYSHFPSKEDLLLGCAEQVLITIQQLFSRVIGAPSSAMERLVTLNMAAWLYYTGKPHHYCLRHIAMSPDVCERASPGKLLALDSIYLETVALVKGLIRDLINSHPSNEGTRSVFDENALLIGIRGMSEGLFQLSISGFGLKHPETKNSDRFSILLTNLDSLLKGWGWPEPFSEKLIDRSSAIAERLVAEIMLNAE